MLRSITNIRALLDRELKQVVRNKLLVSLLIFTVFYVVMLIPHIINNDVQDLKVAVVDNDRTDLSHRLAEKIGLTDKLTFKGVFGTYEDALEEVKLGNVECIAVMPEGLENGFLSGDVRKIQVVVNGVNKTKAQIGMFMVEALLSSSISEYFDEQGYHYLPDTDVISTLNLYNPTMDYTLFIVPLLPLTVGFFICIIIMGITMTADTSNGFMEIINASPVKSWALILSKILACYIISLPMFVATIILSNLLYGLPGWEQAGNIFVCFSVYLFGICAITIIINNVSTSILQVPLIMSITATVLLLMSGFCTPPESMDVVMQKLNWANPSRTFTIILRSIVLKGANLRNLAPWIGTLTIQSMALCALAVVTFKKRN